MNKCGLDVDFWGLGPEEKLCPISWCTNKCLDCVFWSRNDQYMFPQMKGAPFAGNFLEQTFITLITKHISPYEKGVNN